MESERETAEGTSLIVGFLTLCFLKSFEGLVFFLVKSTPHTVLKMGLKAWITSSFWNST